MKFSIKDLNNRNIERHQNFTGFYITKSILVVVRYQTSHLKILSMILIKKQMLIPLRRNHIGLPKTKGTKQSVIVGMVSKLETCGRVSKDLDLAISTVDSVSNIQISYIIFSVDMFSLFTLAIRNFSCIFPHSRTECGEILRIYLSVFRPNAGKYGKNTDQNNSE